VSDDLKEGKDGLGDKKAFKKNKSKIRKQENKTLSSIKKN